MDPGSPLTSERRAKARALAQSRGFGVLTTISKRLPGFPFASLTPYALDQEGRPIFLISDLAVHTKNLVANPNASFFVIDSVAEQDPFSAPRMNLVGQAHPVPANELDAARSTYLERHAEAKRLLEFSDFRLFRLDVQDTYYIGGFGEMGWLSS